MILGEFMRKKNQSHYKLCIKKCVYFQPQTSSSKNFLLANYEHLDGGNELIKKRTGKDEESEREDSYGADCSIILTTT